MIHRSIHSPFSFITLALATFMLMLVIPSPIQAERLELDQSTSHPLDTTIQTKPLDNVVIYLDELGAPRYFVPTTALSCGQSIKIMPLGDSITIGKSSGDTDPDRWVGYRKNLWELLVADGHTINFVGSQTNGQFYQSGGFDPNHEAYGGQTDRWIADHVYDFLTNNPADIVLLHIGTNEIDPDPSDVEDILNEIDRYEADNSTEVTVVLARIIKRINDSGVTTQFNDNVEALAQTRITNGDKIVVVDLENGAGVTYTTPPSGDMWDNLHPAASGHSKIATAWFNALKNVLPANCPDTTPDIISTAPTTGKANQSYTYDVNATGKPVPTYSLSSPPPGMTINSTTGVIDWTPTSAGTVNVTVQASNSAGVDDQPFSIDVASTPTCDTSGVVSYWKLDETSGTTFADFYGNNNASFSGSGSPSYTSGQVNGALTFDGSDQKLTSPITTNPTAQISVMAWINPDTLDAPDRGIISKRGAFALEIEENGDKLSFTSINGSSDEFEPDVPENVIPANAWTHVAATFDGTNVTLYINGISIGSKPTSLGTLGNTSEPYYIGWNSAFSNDRYFSGKIDEAAVFNRALSASEMRELYHRGLTGQGYCAASDVAPTFVSTPVVTATVGQLYNYRAIAAASPAPSYMLPTKPGGMTINATSGLIQWTPTATGTFDVTVQASNSVNPDATQNFQLEVVPEIKEVPQITTTAPTVAVVNQLYSYDVDATGAPVPTYTLTVSPPGMTINSTTGVINWTPTSAGTVNVTVQASNSAGVDDQPFSITVSDTPVCRTSGLVSYWKLDETSGTTFADFFGVNNATFSGSGSPGYTTGQLNGALDFNGSDHKLATGSTTNPTGQISVMAWINPDTLDAPDRGIISKKNAFALEIEENGDKLSFSLINGSTDEFEPNVPANVISAGAWTHVVATFDGTTTALYINGVQIATETSSLNAVGSSSEPYVIGFNSAFDANRYFDGKIDEVAVLNRALSGSEVQGIYNKSTAGTGYCTNPNSPPVITEGDSAQVKMSKNGSPIPFSLTLNATDPDSDPLTWSITKPAGHGTASVTGTPGNSKSISYTPTTDYTGLDSFIVQVSDGSLTDTITVNVVINTPNNTVEANDDTKTVFKNSTNNVIDVLSNDLDSDGDPLSVSLGTLPNHGTAVVSSGKILYTPTTDFVGTDTFTYLATDNKGSLDGATVTVTVVDNASAPDTFIYLPLIAKE